MKLTSISVLPRHFYYETLFQICITYEYSWLRHYATNRKVAGSSPDEVIELFSIYLMLPAANDPGIDSASNRNEYTESSWWQSAASA
jgi:hypothetical protein